LAEAINVIGGGLAGVETAHYIARRGLKVRLYEMRPHKMTPAHQSGSLAELVCSNSLKSMDLEDASGLLKEEMRRMGSLVMEAAERHTVPAGKALAVDRTLFAQYITEALRQDRHIEMIRQEVINIPAAGLSIIATGPLTSEALSASLAKLLESIPLPQPETPPLLPHPVSEEEEPKVGAQKQPATLFFYDAIAPTVAAESVDLSHAFWGSRYDRGGDDYLNCPLTEEEYEKFRQELVDASQRPLHPFEFKDPKFFEACLPLEEIALRGKDALRFGPFRPVGLRDRKSDKRSYAVLQLRREDKEGTMLNLVGCQTRLLWAEQKRIFGLVPALRDAEFLRFGSIHRNTYINAPLYLEKSLQLRQYPHILIAGQLTGVEGYLESAVLGIWAGMAAVDLMKGKEIVPPPPTTALGALLEYLKTANPRDFQPMNINWGLFPPLKVKIKDRRARNRQLSQRALEEMEEWLKKAESSRQ
jgi:methylenetetrahydrofolate--tRNA-(uracil-5-)-methyltransferase